MKVASVILAAGQGTRMRSKFPKVLHKLCGRPMIQYCLDATQHVTDFTPIVVIGHGAEAVQQEMGEKARAIIQEPQLGTGHAVMQVEPILKGEADLVLVTYADMPLLSARTIERVVQAQKSHSGLMTMLTLVTEDARGFGRILRDSQSRVVAIVEEDKATLEQLAIRELNASVYCFNANWLWEALRCLSPSPKGEYYLTDVVEIAVKEGGSIQALQLEDSREAIGINTRIHLAEAEAFIRERVNREWMLAGVTLIDPATTYIEPGVTIGMDTVIWPNTFLQGNTIVGESCELGPNTIVRNCSLGNRCKVFASVLQGAVVEDEVDIGPFGHLRKGAHLAQGVHVGNFGEIKNAYLGPGTKMGHFSYIGDAEIGPKVNIGAGTITCNYDGEKKNRTEIEAGAFIGSDTMLVAPVKIGENARTGAGAVVTKDVPPLTLAVGVPARSIRRLNKRE